MPDRLPDSLPRQQAKKLLTPLLRHDERRTPPSDDGRQRNKEITGRVAGLRVLETGLLLAGDGHEGELVPIRPEAVKSGTASGLRVCPPGCPAAARRLRLREQMEMHGCRVLGDEVSAWQELCLRYEASLERKSAAVRQIVFCGKAYRGRQSQYVYDVLREMCAGPACKAGVLNIPRPIAHIDAAQAVWQEAWEGVERLRLTDDRCVHDFLSRTDLMAKVAALLAALHRTEVRRVRLQLGPSRAAVLERANGDASNIAYFLPEQQEMLGRILESLSRSASNEEDRLPTATIHVHSSLKRMEACAVGDLTLALELLKEWAEVPRHDSLDTP